MSDNKILLAFYGDDFTGSSDAMESLSRASAKTVLFIEPPSKKLLEQITGKPVYYFAYPYGAWNERVIEELKKRGIKEAFQLSEQQSLHDPLFTIRRIMVSDAWSTAKLEEEIHTAFNQRNLAYSKLR